MKQDARDPGPAGPFSFVEAVREFMRLNDADIAKDAAELETARRELSDTDFTPLWSRNGRMRYETADALTRR